MKQNLRMYFGERGNDWLISLPDLLAEIGERWSIQIGEPCRNLSINFVAPAITEDGKEVILKAGVPCHEIEAEINALIHFNSEGAVRIIESDAESGSILLERIVPGTTLAEHAGTPFSIETAAGVMRKLWKPAPEIHSFPDLRWWFSGLAEVRKRFNGKSGPLPSKLFAAAESLASELLNSTEEDVVLHGDCHHNNILNSADRGWVAIDPKGVKGDRVFELCPFLRNPDDRLKETGFIDSIEERSVMLCEILSIDPERLYSWGLAEAVLSASWDLNCRFQSWKRTIAVAEKYASLIGIDI